MADDEPTGEGAAPAAAPAAAAAQPEPAQQPPVRARTTPQQRIEAARDMLDRGYTPEQVRAWMCSTTPDKDWRTTPRNARAYLDRALELVDGEVLAPKSRKQARTRGMLTLFARRALELANKGTLESKAAGLITAGVAALDKIARIDGAYAFDASTLLPASATVATPEEALRLIQHAAALAEMAQRRGALTAAPQPPPVIDASATEVDDEDEPDAAELDADPGDAN